MIATLSTNNGHGYMTRELLQGRRDTWRQKVRIYDPLGEQCFYVDFGEYSDGRLAEIFITSHKTGTFVRGTLDALARAVSLAIQSGTAPRDMARQLIGQDYPPKGIVRAEGSPIDGQSVTSIADYIGREIMVSYGDDGKPIERGPSVADIKENPAGYTPDDWRSGV